MSRTTTLKQALKRFHTDERGLEALQVVMIIAVAAIIMLLVKNNYEKIKEWMEGLVKKVVQFKE